jgi:AmmeMemoRadiSam system radical SAM enzyme
MLRLHARMFMAPDQTDQFNLHLKWNTGVTKNLVRLFPKAATRRGDRMVLTTYGRSSGFCIDPIEKKPLNHFLSGTPVLSFGTAGCNLTCRFCQNWDISKAHEFDRLTDEAPPEAAVASGCRSGPSPTTDPVVFYEYAIDVAQACRETGVKTVAVCAGYMCDGTAGGALSPVKRHRLPLFFAIQLELLL